MGKLSFTSEEEFTIWVNVKLDEFMLQNTTQSDLGKFVTRLARNSNSLEDFQGELITNARLPQAENTSTLATIVYNTLSKNTQRINWSESDPRDADDARYGRDFDGSRITVEAEAPRGSRDNGSRGPPPGSGRCINCGADGHWARDCTAGDWKNKCYRCGERGHIERHCKNSPSPKKARSPVKSRPPRGRRSPSRSRSYSRRRSYSRSRSPVRREKSVEDRSRSPKAMEGSAHESLKAHPNKKA